jgi:hypothetical protein
MSDFRNSQSLKYMVLVNIKAIEDIRLELDIRLEFILY